MMGYIFLTSTLLLFVGTATVAASTAQCDALFKAAVQVRGHLIPIAANAQYVEAFKQGILVWTKIDIDDDIALRQAICKLVGSTSLEEMASVLRIPISFWNLLYSKVKSQFVLVKAMAKGQLYSSIEPLSDARRQALRSVLHLFSVVETSGLLRFTAPPTPAGPTGCTRLMSLAFNFHRDRHLIKVVNSGAINRLKNATGIDLQNWNEFHVIVCKLGEVRNQVELANVLDLPVDLVRNNYGNVISYLRSMEEDILGNRLHPVITDRISANILSFLRGLKQEGIYELPAQ